ncbi:MAG: hypothetical protein ACRYHA_12635 [Janthinobacterium lividum]
MKDIIKPVSMILTLQALHHMGRRQLSVGIIACFRFGAARIDSLLTETASHVAWSRLTGPLAPIDNGIPTRAQSVIVHDGYWHPLTAQPDNAQRPYLLGTETLILNSKLRGQPSLSATLPGLRAQCFIEWAGGRGEQVRKLDPQIESLRLSPRLGCGWLLYRAVTPIASACLDDIVSVNAGWNAIDQPTVRPDRSATEWCRSATERYRSAAEREVSAWRHGLAGSTCVS